MLHVDICVSVGCMSRNELIRCPQFIVHCLIVYLVHDYKFGLILNSIYDLALRTRKQLVQFLYYLCLFLLKGPQ